MPRQNRVDPFGNIIAHPGYGMLMGNRGCLHDNNGNLVRTAARDAWITCLPRWPGVRRTLMAPGQYTELFFLDEATAMAAGHRPCGSCRPEALGAFKQAWQRTFRLVHLPRVAEMDEVLRSVDRQMRPADGDLSSGTIIAVAGQPLLRWGGDWFAWTFDGYEPHAGRNVLAAAVVTPAPMLSVLRHGYVPLVHPTATVADRTGAIG